VLIVGCGDIGLRSAARLTPNVRVLALSSGNRQQELRRHGITPLSGNLDLPATLGRLAGIATRVLHLAPPVSQGSVDTRTRALLRALSRRGLPVALVYGSTSGVYGDCGGAWVAETRALRPQSARAQRRCDAERSVRRFGRSTGVRSSILRIPGIYSPDRVGATPRERLQRGTPVLLPQDDVFTNHIHADDLARACLRALWKATSQRCYNISDDSTLKMGDYYDAAADLYGLPRPPRIGLDAARRELPTMLLSFMQESRRLHNGRMKRELGLRLRFSGVLQGLAASTPSPPVDHKQ
jgi:nucleoside-diphosphate-sugar epimerase